MVISNPGFGAFILDPRLCPSQSFPCFTMRLWELFIFSSPGRLIAFCWKLLFIREHKDDEEALINSVQVVPKRKALLLGVMGSGMLQEQREGIEPNAAGSLTEDVIKGPHYDVIDMRQALIDIYDYNPEDITVLINDSNLEPTEENIIREMNNLVVDARPGDRFYFHYSGHGTQLADDNSDEEDGWDECIITSDDKMIRDDKLKEVMLKPLPSGCSFVSVLDACHSGTLLDLTHHRCNRVYVPWVSKRKIPRSHPDGDSANHQTVSPQAEHLTAHPTTLSAEEVARSDIHVNHDFTLTWSKMSKQLPFYTRCWVYCRYMLFGSKELSHHYCCGICRKDSYFIKDVGAVADVISLSSAKDYQLSWGQAGSSLTQALIEVLRVNKNPNITHLLKTVSHKLHNFYVHELHPRSREYERWLKRQNRKRRKEGKALKHGRTVEADNFQDPQISSHRPLSEDKKWEL